MYVDYKNRKLESLSLDFGTALNFLKLPLYQNFKNIKLFFTHLSFYNKKILEFKVIKFVQKKRQKPSCRFFRKT
jgi:hypothetical protein